MALCIDCLSGSVAAFAEPATQLTTADSTKHGVISLCASMLFSCFCVVLASIGIVYGVMVFWYTSLEVVGAPT